jgi:hypothetical protein
LDAVAERDSAIAAFELRIFVKKQNPKAAGHHGKHSCRFLFIKRPLTIDIS